MFYEHGNYVLTEYGDRVATVKGQSARMEGDPAILLPEVMEYSQILDRVDTIMSAVETFYIDKGSKLFILGKLYEIQTIVIGWDVGSRQVIRRTLHEFTPHISSPHSTFSSKYYRSRTVSNECLLIRCPMITNEMCCVMRFSLGSDQEESRREVSLRAYPTPLHHSVTSTGFLFKRGDDLLLWSPLGQQEEKDRKDCWYYGRVKEREAASTDSSGCR